MQRLGTIHVEGFAYRSFILLTAANCAAFVGAAMTAMRYRARDDGQIGDSATWLVSATVGCSILACAVVLSSK